MRGGDYPMRALFVALVLGFGLIGSPAQAEDARPAPEAGVDYDQLQQVPLTEAQINGYVEAIPDMQAAIGDTPADAAEPDAKTMAKLEETVRKHGFKSFDDYNTIAGNISLVLDGIDPQSQRFVGADKLIEKAVAAVKADAQMKDDERIAALADLERQKAALPAVKYPGNIDLVLKNYAKLTGDDVGK